MNNENNKTNENNNSGNHNEGRRMKNMLNSKLEYYYGFGMGRYGEVLNELFVHGNVNSFRTSSIPLAEFWQPDNLGRITQVLRPYLSRLDAAKTSVGKYADCLFSWTRVGDATVKAYDPAAGKVTLRWDAIPEASYYRLEASVDGGITWDVASACFRNTYKTVAGVDPSASYVFRVTALNAAKKSIGLYADCSFNADVNANALLDEAFAGYFDNLL